MMDFDEMVIEMNEKDVFKKLYEREVYRGKITSDRCVAHVTPSWDGYNVKWIRRDEMTDEFPILGKFALPRSVLED